MTSETSWALKKPSDSSENTGMPSDSRVSTNTDDHFFIVRSRITISEYLTSLIAPSLSSSGTCNLSLWISSLIRFAMRRASITCLVSLADEVSLSSSVAGSSFFSEDSSFPPSLPESIFDMASPRFFETINTSVLYGESSPKELCLSVPFFSEHLSLYSMPPRVSLIICLNTALVLSSTSSRDRKLLSRIISLPFS